MSGGFLRVDDKLFARLTKERAEKRISLDEISCNNPSEAHTRRNVIVIVSVSFFFLKKKENFDSCSCAQTPWTELKADGNLGFLMQSESLTSEHDASFVVVMCYA